MMELEYHHFATPNKIVDVGRYHQWLLKPVGEKLINLNVMKNRNRCYVPSLKCHGKYTPPPPKYSWKKKKKKKSQISSSLIYRSIIILWVMEEVEVHIEPYHGGKEKLR